MNSWNISYELNDFLRGKNYFTKNLSNCNVCKLYAND